MASGLSASLSGGSEEGFVTHCSPCFDNGISKEAIKYCMDCCVNYCEPCLKTHNKIPLLQGHQIVDKSGQGVRSTRTALPTEQCVIHQGKLVDMFCTNHDIVCCAACIAINYRSCVKVDYLPDVAKGIKTSQEYRDVNDSLDELMNKLNKEKTKRLEYLSSLKKDKNTADEEITRVEEELKKTITELAQHARTELLAKYNEGRKATEADITNVESVIIKVKAGKDKLKSANDAQLFLNVKDGKMIIKDEQTLLSALSKTEKKKCLTFMPNKDLQQLAQQLNLLGTIYIKDEEREEGLTEVREYTAKLQGKYKVNDTPCSVTSVCILNDTTVMIFECQNKNLKRLNMTDFKVVDQLKMEDFSWSVCSTGSQEVAVALYYKQKIQFVSVAGTMTLTRSFSTDHYCHGIAFNQTTGELIVSNNGNQVKVYDKTGNVLKSYINDDKGKPLFSRSAFIASSADQNTLFITDFDNGLIALDKLSSLQWVFSDKQLKNAYGVCVLPGGVILVSGVNSHNLIQVDKHGKKIKTLIAGADDNLRFPRALAYHHNTSRLIVGHETNEIYVYTLSSK